MEGISKLYKHIRIELDELRLRINKRIEILFNQYNNEHGALSTDNSVLSLVRFFAGQPVRIKFVDGTDQPVTLSKPMISMKDYEKLIVAINIAF